MCGMGYGTTLRLGTGGEWSPQTEPTRAFQVSTVGATRRSHQGNER